MKVKLHSSSILRLISSCMCVCVIALLVESIYKQAKMSLRALDNKIGVCDIPVGCIQGIAMPPHDCRGKSLVQYSKLLKCHKEDGICYTNIS